jgi:hypothetical protein
MHIRVDHAEPKTEIQAEQVQWVFGGPQASSCEDANIAVIKARLGVFYLEALLYILSWIAH